MYSEYDSWFTSEINPSVDDTLSNVLNHFEKVDKSKLSPDNQKWCIWDYELIYCTELRKERQQEGQTYLFPTLIYTNGKKIPDVDNFEPERMIFYLHRYGTVTNMHLKIRYMNYLFEKCESSQKYNYAKLLCENIKAILDASTAPYSLTYISRFLDVSVRFGLEIGNTIIRIIGNMLLQSSTLDGCLELHFVLFIIMPYIKNRKVQIEESTLDAYIMDLQRITQELSDKDHYEVYRCVAVYLMNFMTLRGMDAHENKVIFGCSYIAQADRVNTYLAKAHLLEEAVRYYIDNGLREYVYQLKVSIKDAYRKAKENDEFQNLSVDLSISKEKLEEESKVFWGATIKETLENVSGVNYFIQKKSEVQAVVEKYAKNPIYLFLQMSYIYGNRKVADVQDADALNNMLFCQNYMIGTEIYFNVLFGYIWNRMLENGLDSTMVIDRICSCPYMDDLQKEFVAIGIRHFFNNDYISALHILVPQFEGLFRSVFEWGGYPTTTIRHGSTQSEQIFSEYLKNDFVIACIEENLLYMIEFVMVNQLGYNLRNNIAHGIAGASTFNRGTCFMVLYLYFLITKLRWKYGEGNQSDASTIKE